MDYRHGGDIYSQEIFWDFSVNVNPLGPPEGVKEAVRQSAEYCARYPDSECRELVYAIADHIRRVFQVRLEQEDILCGNGAADLLYQFAFAGKPRNTLIPTPTFSEYAQALQAAGCRVRTVFFSKESGFSIDTDVLETEVCVLKNKGKKPEILCLCNPNNPTGQIIERPQLVRLAEFAEKRKIILLLDECFMDFSDCPEKYSMIPCFHDFPHLVIIKAFTKFYGMAGLRLGFGLTKNHFLLEQIRALRQPWSVSIPAQMAGVAALKEDNYGKKTRKIIAQGRKQLFEGLSRLGFLVYPSAANFLFFQDLREGAESGMLYRACKEKKLLLRSCGNFEGLDGSYYRICVKTKEENEHLLSMLNAVLQMR